MQKEKSSIDYQLVKKLISEMNVGDIQTVKPDKVERFRIYLTSESQKVNKYFTTRKAEDGRVMVARIKKEVSFWDKQKK